MSYALDSEGYVIVEFEEPTEPEISECIPDGVLEDVQGPGCQKAIERLDFTNRLRVAWVEPEAAKIVYRLYGLKGVPLGWGRTDTGELFETPFQIHPHQIKAIEWMRKRELTKQHGLRGGLLCLWMGLGKSLCSTLQIMCYKESNFPSLIVTSLTLMHSWKSSNFDKFFGGQLKVLYFHKTFLGDNTLPQITRSTILKYDIVITTYDVVNSAAKATDYHSRCFEYTTGKQSKIASIHLPTYEMADMPNVKGLGIIYGTPWERVICDETQTFANPDTNTFKSIMGIYGRYKWCLSGTPIRNYETDIWAQLRFCGYEGVDRVRVWGARGLSYMKEHNLRDAILRMTYEDAGIKLPPLEEKHITIVLSEKEREVYNHVMKAVQTSYDKMMNKMCSFTNVLAQFIRLRQASIAPYLITEDRGLIPDAKLSKWCSNIKLAGYSSTKTKQIIEVLSEIPKGEKVLIFSMFVKCLNLVRKAVETAFPHYTFLQLDGTTENRTEVINQFKKDKNVKALFLAYKVGGQGLNLTVANHCIPIEPWWTSDVYKQAVARCWRFGQTKKVIVYNIIGKDTIEENIIALAKTKEAMADRYLMDGGEVAESKLTKYTMGVMINKF